jgi:[acyl-carrier-protein] S-malonyltransferase
MGRFLFDNFKIAKERFEEASDVLGQNFKKLCFEGPESDLALTENTQPALLLVSTVTYQVAQAEFRLQIGAGAGHSIGEYAAVVCSGALDFADGLRAVRKRGQAMQKAVPVGEGAMLAVLGLNEEQVRKLCLWAELETGLSPLEPANFNAPGQIVVSGSARLIEWVRTNAKTELFLKQEAPLPKMRLIPLNVSAPFHCSLMKPAQDEMRQVLSDLSFKKAAWPIVQNTTAQESQDPEVIRQQLIDQVSGAVRWTDCMQRLKQMGFVQSVELGAGKVLSGLAKKIDSEIDSGSRQTLNVNSIDDFKILETAMLETAVEKYRD